MNALVISIHVFLALRIAATQSKVLLVVLLVAAVVLGQRLPIILIRRVVLAACLVLFSVLLLHVVVFGLDIGLLVAFLGKGFWGAVVALILLNTDVLTRRPDVIGLLDFSLLLHFLAALLTLRLHLVHSVSKLIEVLAH